MTAKAAANVFITDSEGTTNQRLCDTCLDEFLRTLRIGETLSRGDTVVIHTYGDGGSALLECEGPRCPHREEV